MVLFLAHAPPKLRFVVHHRYDLLPAPSAPDNDDQALFAAANEQR